MTLSQPSFTAPFEPGTAYSKFAAYALLDHRGDYSTAAKSLRASGYGADEPEMVFGPPAGLPPDKGAVAPPTTEQTADAEVWSHADLLKHDFGPIDYLVADLIANASVTILGGVQKAGKSWLSIQMAQAVAGQGDGLLLGKRVATGRVVYLALEDGARRLRDRLITQKSRATLDITWVTKFPKLDTPEGLLRLRELLDTRPSLLIIDTLAAAKSGRSSVKRPASSWSLFLPPCS